MSRERCEDKMQQNAHRRARQQGLGLDSFKGSDGDGPGSKTAKMKEQLNDDAKRLIALPKGGTA